MKRWLFNCFAAVSAILAILLTAIWIFHPHVFRGPMSIAHHIIYLTLSHHTGYLTISGPITNFTNGIITTGFSFPGFSWEIASRVNRPFQMIRIGIGLPILLTLLLVTPSLWIANLPRRRSMMPPHLCKTCGYDLRATPNRCPECGNVPSHPIPETTHPHS